MATTYSLTGSLTDLLGATTLQRVTAYVEASERSFVSLDDSKRRHGRIPITLGPTGSFTVTGLAATGDAGYMPVIAAWRLVVEYRDSVKGSEFVTESTNWFPMTANRTLAQVIQADPNFIAAFNVTNINNAVAAAQAAANQATSNGAVQVSLAAEQATAAQTARQQAEALVISDLGTTDGQTRALIEAQGSQVRGALANVSVLTPMESRIVADGVTDDAAAWASTLASGVRVFAMPSATSRIRSQISPGGKVVRGVSRRVSVLHGLVKAGEVTDFIRAATGQEVSDLKVKIERGTGITAAAVGFDQDATDVAYERLAIQGVAGPDLLWGFIVRDSDISDVLIRDVLLQDVTLGTLKGNEDTSTQRRWRFENVRGKGGIDGININTPSGVWADGHIDAYMEGYTQFPYAFAGPGCYNWRGTLRGADNDYELVHIEDACSRMSFAIVGERCNTSPGAAGSPAAANGMVQVIGGSHAIDLDYDVDLTKNTGGSPTALAVQHGGPRVSDGLTVNPYDITARGRIRGGAGDMAVWAIECPDLKIDLDLDSPGNGDVMSPALKIPGSHVTGRLRVRNPGIIFEINDNTPTPGLDELHITGSVASFTKWATGFTSGRTSVPIARHITLTVPFAVDDQYGDGTEWNTICPAFYEFTGRATWKFQQNGGANGYVVVTDDLKIKDGAITAGTFHTVNAGGSSDGLIDAGGGPIRISDGRLQIRGYNAIPSTGTLTVAFDGVALA